jgi:MFS family permease
MSFAENSESQPVYRWVIVIASAVMLAVAMGLLVNGMSVFFLPLNAEFGWQRGSVSLINLSGLVGLALGGIVMGRIADRTTTRRVTLFGAFVLGLSILGTAWIQSLWQICALFFLAGFFGAGALFTPLVANVGSWFKTGAGLALGITAAGQALGQGGVPFGAAVLIGEFGWRNTLTTMGIIALVTLVPLALLIRQPPPGEVAAGPGTSAKSDSTLYPLPAKVTTIWLSAAVVFCCTTMSVVLMHLVPLVQDRGIPLENAGSVIFLLLVVAIAGRVAFGKLADIIGAIPAYMTATAWMTLMVFGFVLIGDLNSFYLYAVIYGFGYAGVMTGILVCVRVLIPPAHRASALGIVIMFAWLGHAIGGYQGGFFFDLTGNYTVSYANAALAGVINLIIVGALYLTITRRRAAMVVAA